MNRAFIGRNYDIPTKPGTSELGVALFSSSRLIKETIDGRPSSGKWYFLLITEGSCEFICNDRSEKYGRGLLVVPPLQNSISVSLGNAFQGFLFCFPKNLVSYGWDSTLHTILSMREVKQLMNYFYLMRDVSESADHPKSCLEMSCLCRAFVASCEQHFTARTQYQGARPTEISNDFLNLVARHCDRERGLQFYADRFGITPKYLSTIISSTTNKTAGKWIVEYTIEYAKKLLTDTRMTVLDIASKMGFHSSSDFCRYFKTHTGQAPKSYRSQELLL